MGQTIPCAAANQGSPLFSNGCRQDPTSQSVKGNQIRGSLRQPIRKIHVDSSQPNQKGAVTSMYVLCQPIRMLTNRRISLPANQNADKSTYFFASQSECWQIDVFLCRPIRKSQTYPHGVFASQSEGGLGADPSVIVSPSPAAAVAISCKIHNFCKWKKSDALILYNYMYDIAEKKPNPSRETVPRSNLFLFEGTVLFKYRRKGNIWKKSALK